MAASPRLYFDYASTTPIDPRVFRAMRPYFMDEFGNPGSLHSYGQKAVAALDGARQTLADILSVDFSEVVFTASATEANNLALRGIIASLRKKNMRETKRNTPYIPHSTFHIPKLIVSAIEHESVLGTAEDMARNGKIDLVILPVDKNGLVNLKKLKQELDERTVLVSIMYANNETGVIQPLAKVARIIRNFRMSNYQLPITNTSSKRKLDIGNWELAAAYPLLHSDCSQAFQFLDCSPEKLGVDLITLSSHKIYGPKGAGALACASSPPPPQLRRASKFQTPNIKQVPNYKQNPNTNQSKNQNSTFWNLGFGAWSLSRVISPLATGGHQEFGLRAGTENMPAIVGFAKAAELILVNRETETARLTGLRNYFYRALKKISPRISINGPSLPHSTFPSFAKASQGEHIPHSIPSILNIQFPGHPADELLTRLDLMGVAVSSGSACRARSPEPSYVLRAMGLGEKHTRESLRFSLGRPTNKTEIDRLLTVLNKILRSK